MMDTGNLASNTGEGPLWIIGSLVFCEIKWINFDGPIWKHPIPYCKQFLLATHFSAIATNLTGFCLTSIVDCRMKIKLNQY